MISHNSKCCPQCKSKKYHEDFWDQNYLICNNCWFCWDKNYENLKTIRKKKLEKISKNKIWKKIKNKICLI